MDPKTLRDRDLIAGLEQHIDAAIRASPMTCDKLRSDVILELAQKYGLNSKTRIEEFDKLRRNVDQVYSSALSKLQQDSGTMSLMQHIRSTIADPAISLSTVNGLMNDFYTKHKITKIVRDCEEIAVAYNVALQYAWSQTTTLTRFIRDEGELEHMLNTCLLESNVQQFVSASITESRFLNNRPVLYKIRVTPKYRMRTSVLTYISVFKRKDPETQNGYKNYDKFEDEVRIRNATPIEPGTIEIIFRYSKPSTATIKTLQQKYAPLGPVTFEPRKTR